MNWLWNRHQFYVMHQIKKKKLKQDQSTLLLYTLPIFDNDLDGTYR